MSWSRTLRTLRLWGILLRGAFRSQAQYRGNLVLLLTGGIAYQSAGLVFIWIVLDRFGDIGGWTLHEVVFLYALRLTAHGFWLLFLNQLIYVDEVVREGEFDRYLVRPLNPLVQLMTRRIQLTVLGDFISGFALLVVASRLVDVDWSLAAIGYLALAVIGGALVEGGVHLIFSSLSFRLLSTGGLRFLSDELFNIFASYPMKIFPAAARFGLMFVLPLAFVAYLPATVVLDRTGELWVQPIFAYLAPLVGVAVMAAAYLVWRRQTRYYSSSGH